MNHHIEEFCQKFAIFILIIDLINFILRFYFCERKNYFK